MVGGLTDLLKPKWLENRWVSAKTNKSFYELQDNSAEVVFFGASIISAAMDPFQLYEEQGISSYNLGVMSQPMIGTYYWFKEALKTQNMKLAVIEIKSAGRSSEKAEEKARKSYDYMKWGKNKIQYALDYKDFHKEADGTDEEVDLWSYLFPLSLYHTRWSELSYDDYDFFLGKNNSNTKGFSVLSTQFKNSTSFDAEKEAKGKYDGFEVKSNDKETPNPINEEYALKLIKEAKQQGVELLFVRTPDTTWHEDQHNYIQELADKNNIKFLDLNLKSNMDKMQFDYSEDAADTVHVNILGAKKITKFVGQYIADNYKLTDYRKTDNSIKKDFESQKSNYQAALNEGKLNLITNFDEYLKAINTDEYSVIITSGSNVRNITFTDSQKKTLISMGADEALFTDSTYGNNVICVLDGDNSKNKVKKQLEDNSKVTTLGGTLTCGTDYDITANSKGGTMRLGSYPCQIKEGTLAYKIYKQKNINERHRHRFEYNNDYREEMGKAGLTISGTSPDGSLVEIVEIKDHPFFIAGQFHPEFKSRPDRPAPLFVELVKAAKERE